jgi:L-ribulose-5-phosphate 4-epimerase
MSNCSFPDLREECCEANRQLPASGLVDLTFGNVSVADRAAGVFAIKPSGVAYKDLTPSDMVVVDFAGRMVDGKLRPSSDTPTHAFVLRSFEGVRSVVHTHSRYAVSFAQAGREIPLLGTTHADYFRGAVPVTRALTEAEIDQAYEAATGEVIVETLAGRNPLEFPAVLVRHHGPFSWGSNGAKAVETALALEIIAQMALQTLTLQPSIDRMPEKLSETHFLRKHGAMAYYGQFPR